MNKKANIKKKKEKTLIFLSDLLKVKRLPNLAWFLFLIIYLEMIFKMFVFKNVFSINTLRIILFSLPFAIIFYLITNIFSEKINRIFSNIISALITFLYGAQLIYFAFYDSVFSVYSLKTGVGQALDFTSMIFTMIGRNLIWVILIILPCILYFIFNKRLFSFKRLDNTRIVLLFSTFILLCYSVVNFISLNTTGMYSLSRLYNDTHAPMLTINKMGLLMGEKLDIQRFFGGFEEKVYIEDKKDDIELIPEVKYNILEIDFETLINNETNETIKNMHTYFKNVEPTKQNEYTGMFKDKNLIYIVAEGFDTIGVHPEVTPTLYKMANNGFVFKNYYQPLFGVSTTDGEYMTALSLIPKEGVWSFYRSSNVYLPFALGNMYSRIGYSTNAYHNHSYRYYSRDESHPNMGFTYKGCGNGLEKLMNCRTWPESDLEMINVTVGDYINNEKFLAYYMTVSGHLNYTFTGNMMAYKNKDLVKDLPYSSNVRAYLATHIELDRAMEKLLNELETAGKLDDTLIVIAPDHYPYGLKVSEINEISKIDRSGKFDLFHTTLIMYNSNMENVYVDKYVSSIDVLPTVYNLFGMEYDSRLLMGTDALSDSEGLVMLSDRSWINENGSYNSINGVFTPFKNNLSETYKDEINSKVYNKFTMSSLIVSESGGRFIDYYSRLGL